MALLLVISATILAFSLANTEQCVSPTGSSIDFYLRSHKNASGDWIITVETQRLIIKEDPREILINVHQETKVCGKTEIEQLVTVAVYPSLHDTSMAGPIKPSTTRPTTITTSTTTTAMPSTTTTTTTTTTTKVTASTATTTASATTPKSCPHSGYQLYPECNCYKAFRDEYKTWSEARHQCMTDGGDLMVMESEREREDVYISLRKSVGIWSRYPWVGVYIPEGEDGWMTVNGKPALSTWWGRGYPKQKQKKKKKNARKCAQADNTGLLENINNCELTRPFICEISL